MQNRNTIMGTAPEGSNLPTVKRKNHSDRWRQHRLRCNEEQCRAIEMVHDAQYKICAIQGPPGTGKSFTLTQIIAEMAHSLDQLKSSKQVMTQTPTNKTAEDMTRHISAARDPEGRPIRVVWAVSRTHMQYVATDVLPYTLRELAVHQPEGYERPLNPIQQEKLAQKMQLQTLSVT